MEESLNKISINELYDLIKLYKQATVNGEKIELIISYPYEKGVYDYSKRIITIGIVGGYTRDRDSFIVDSLDFDKYVLPNIVEYYSYGDSLSSFDKTYVSNYDIYKGISETESGNILYIEEKDDNYDILKKGNTLESSTFTNTDKVWEEILNYTKERKKVQDFYRSANFTYRELGKINNFIIKLSDDKNIKIENRRKSRENNVNYITELFKDKDKVLSLGLSEEVYQKLIDKDAIKQLAEFSGREKRLRSRIDVENSNISNKIRFAIDELGKVDYFNLKNAPIKSFKSKDFLLSKPLALIKLKHIIKEDNYDYEGTLNYQKYCDEILQFLERNAKRDENEKISKIEKDIKLERYNNTLIDQYEDLSDAISLVVGARVNDEKYEIVVEDNKENNNTIVRVSLVSNIVKTDSFIFEFSDKNKIKEELGKIEEKIKKINLDNEINIKYLGSSVESLNSVNIGNDKLFNNNDIINEVNEINVDSNKNEIEQDLNIQNNTLEIENNNLDTLNKEVVIEEKSSENDEISIENLENLEKIFSDYMLEKENKKEFVEIPFMNLSISTYELLLNKYKDKLNEMYINNLLPKEEKEVIDNINYLKSKLEIYYNETVERSSSLIEEEIKRLANCEVALASIYKLDLAYNSSDLKNDTPSNTLRTKIYQKEYKENNTYIDKLTDEYINKYNDILQKYEDNKKYDEKELIGDKDTLLQIITYKMKLKDAYDGLLSRNNLSQEDLSLVNKYEKILNKIYSIDAKYQDNKEKIIKELKNEEKFLTPSSKMYLELLENEYNKTINKEENEYLFEIISKKDTNDDEIEFIKKAYYKAEANSTSDNPLNIKIEFDNDNKSEAKLNIYNYGDKEEEYSYRNTLSSETIKELIPILCELFNENKLEFVYKYNLTSSDDLCLLGFTEDKKIFKIINADEELIDYAKDELEVNLKKEEGMKK